MIAYKLYTLVISVHHDFVSLVNEHSVAYISNDVRTFICIEIYTCINEIVYPLIESYSIAPCDVLNTQLGHITLFLTTGTKMKKKINECLDICTIRELD